MSTARPKQTIGRSEKVSLPEYSIENIPARIDTGARTTSIWASNMREVDGCLKFVLFDKDSHFYTGKIIAKNDFSLIVVASSNGHKQVRYKVMMSIRIRGRLIRTFCTLADRSTQAFPILIGRNTLKGKFIVDVGLGSSTLDKLDQDRYDELQSQL